MKKLKQHLVITAFLAVLTLSASLFTTSNLLVQAAVAQTTGGSTGTGPQDGGDGKKKRCRPPKQCPTTSDPNRSSGENGIETTELNSADESESSNWWGDFINWFSGE